jgi:hypothetical protein
MNLLVIGNPPRANAKQPDECPDEYRVWEDARLLPAVHAAYHAIGNHAPLPAPPEGRGWDVALLFNSAWRTDAAALLRDLRRRNHDVKVALWVFDFAKQSRIVQNKAVAEQVDYFFYTDGHSDWDVSRPGGRLNQGVPSSWQRFGAERTHAADFVYTGRAYKHRLEIIQQLAARHTIVWHNNGPECESIPNVRFAPPVYDQQLFEACCRARFCLVPSYKAGLSHYWSNRIYLAAATGVPCFVEAIDGLEAEFVADRDVIAFRRETLLEQAAHYTSNYAAAERIGTRGRELVFSKHTYRHRLETMLERMA